MYKFNAIPINTSKRFFFLDITLLYLQLYGNPKELEQPKQFCKEEKLADLHDLISRLYYEATEIEIMWY